MTLFDDILRTESRMTRLMAERVSDFRSPEEMRLTAIGIDPLARAAVEETMDAFWADRTRRQSLINELASMSTGSQREVIIGAGYSAAVYAATRAALGMPKPIVIERADRVGGTFALAGGTATFNLNSRNRPGGIGLAGDRTAALNYIPNGPLQPSSLSNADYQSNDDMAFTIRLALAKYADVISGATVANVEGNGSYGSTFAIDGAVLYAGRIIDARGLGDPVMKTDRAAKMYNYLDFMTLMTSPFPLRGVRKVAVLGGGDSGKCVMESLLGLAPRSSMTVAALDMVEKIDWYAPGLPDTCERWRQEIRGRYQGIGQALRPDRFGTARASVFNLRATPVPVPGSPLVSGRSYDMVVMTTGNREVSIPGLESGLFDPYVVGGAAVATRNYQNDSIFRVGPHAYLPFTVQERETGVAEISANMVAMFRTGTKTASLAATLPGLV